MGLFSSSTKFNEIPGIQPYLDNLLGFGDKFNLGENDFGTRQSRKFLKQLGSGDYSGLMGTILNPIHNAAETSRREGERGMQMGANAMYQGTQPALMAGLSEETRLRSQEQEGLAMSSAIPQLYGQVQSAYGAGRGRSLQGAGLDLQSLIAALQGKIGANQASTSPSLFSQFSGAAAGLAPLLAGL